MKIFLIYLLLLEGSILFGGMVRSLPLLTVEVEPGWLLVVYLGFFAPLFPGAVSVFLIGLAEESLFAPIHGPRLASYLAVYLFLRVTRQRLFFEKGASQMIWVVLLSLAQRGIECGLLIGAGYRPSLALWGLLPTAFLNGLISLRLFPFLRKGGRLSHGYGS